MKLEILHLTQYKYMDPVVDSINEIRLTPLTNERQSCEIHSVMIEPNVSLFSYADYYGNQVHSFSLSSPHQSLTIKTYSVVDVDETVIWRSSNLLYTDEFNILESDDFQNDFAEYLMSTPCTQITPKLKTFIDEMILGNKADSISRLLEHISSFIHTQFKFDPMATHVHKTVEETLLLKRGVCQEFTHLMLAVCRYLQIPARYVSGYHFIGDLDEQNKFLEHSSHAWVEAYVPEVGWLGFDPTNNGEISWRYVKLGHGRDYSDIVPVKGVYYGTGRQDMEVSVEIKKMTV